MKKIVLIIACALSFCVSAQSRTNGDNEKEGKEALKDGNFYYSKGVAFYNLAIKSYMIAYDSYADEAEFNYKLATCYLYSSEKEKAKTYFERAYKIDPKVSPDILFDLGYANHLMMKWDEAISYYSQFINTASNAAKKPEAEKKIAECRNGKAIGDAPSEEILIENLGSSVNSEFEDYAPVITADGSTLIFTSRRPDNKGNQLLFENIYASHRVKDEWSASDKLSEKINTRHQHNSNIGLSTDGQRLLVYKDEKGTGNIYESQLRGMEWTEPKKLKGDINSKYHESSASYAFDGKTLYFVSERPGGAGGKDIYSSTLDEQGEWGPAVNIGSALNTQHNEEGVFAHPDGRTLYFSSQGHSSIGGYDIFMTTNTNGKWSEPVNMGRPVNTADDDLFFVVAASGKMAFFSSVRPGGLGGKDIYKLTFKEKREEKKEKKDFVTVFKGTVTDENDRSPVEASIEITDLEKNVNIATFRSNSATGNFLVTLQAGRNYGISVNASGYLFHSENFNIPVVEEYTEITRDIRLKKMTVGTRVVLNNIFFDYGKASLRTESISELDRLAKLMKENPAIRVQISGHTDNQGSEEFNKKLSHERARSVVEYLEKAGVAADRLKFMGYGFSRPRASNDSEEGRQQNRRTEFEVVE